MMLAEMDEKSLAGRWNETHLTANFQFYLLQCMFFNYWARRGFAVFVGDWYKDQVWIYGQGVIVRKIPKSYHT